ncbi:hypothetical protein GQ600_16415 [Phytophthora cactorum]|nr:hypothetical protein GQ600_16415 [Phytophthora cactorum]
MTELCPAVGLQMSQVWWNIETTHYYHTHQGRLCHMVSSQDNCHGNYGVGTEKAEASSKAPASCTNNSYVVDMYFYHGTIGFYSFYEEITYCSTDHTIYGRIVGLDTFDIIGSFLARDGRSHGYRMSYWYATVGTMSILYRAVVLRRSYISCKRFVVNAMNWVRSSIGMQLQCLSMKTCVFRLTVPRITTGVCSCIS